MQIARLSDKTSCFRPRKVTGGNDDGNAVGFASLAPSVTTTDVTTLTARRRPAGSSNQVRVLPSLPHGMPFATPDDIPSILADLYRRAGGELHLRVDAIDGQIAPNEIGEFVRNSSGVWFCGPSGWAKVLQAALHKNFGLQTGSFHRELFEFR